MLTNTVGERLHTQEVPNEFRSFMVLLLYVRDYCGQGWQVCEKLVIIAGKNKVICDLLFHNC